MRKHSLFARHICAIALFLCLSAVGELNARNLKFALSTNAVEWANFGTINLEAGMGVSQHFSIQAGALYNPWQFKIQNTGDFMYNKQTSAFVGARWWPWYVFSGWWVGMKAKYTDAAITGVWRPALKETTSAGVGLSCGYTLMIHERLNIDFGIGCWGGYHFKYNLYDCPKCMEIRESGARGFIGIDTVSISLMYVF
ncbi:MAG: DUF3575 domain-containing protein [Candidatus Cryptobacteroides sp.]